MTVGAASLVPTVLAQGGEGSYIVTPSPGLMIWTLVTFALTVGILAKFAFPRIAEALDKRRRSIEESIDRARQARREADELLEDYRERLKEARQQAEDIVARAQKAADGIEDRAQQEAEEYREEQMERTKREIDREMRRALDELREEVATMTVMATERLTRKTLDGDDHRRLIEEALEDADFSRLAPSEDGAAAQNGAGAEDEEAGEEAEAGAGGAEDER